MLITEAELKKATGERTLSGLKRWLDSQGIRYFATKNGITTTENALNFALHENSVDPEIFNLDLVR